MQRRLWIDRAVAPPRVCIPYRSRGPDPAGAHHLFSLATAGLGQDGAPLDLGLVVGVDGVGDVQGVLENLAGAGVHHGLLRREKSQLTADCIYFTSDSL